MPPGAAHDEGACCKVIGVHVSIVRPLSSAKKSLEPQRHSASWLFEASLFLTIVACTLEASPGTSFLRKKCGVIIVRYRALCYYCKVQGFLEPLSSTKNA